MVRAGPPRTAASLPPPNESPAADDKLGAGPGQASRHIHIQRGARYGRHIKIPAGHGVSAGPGGGGPGGGGPGGGGLGGPGGPAVDHRADGSAEKCQLFGGGGQIRRVTAVITTVTREISWQKRPLSETRLFSPKPRNDRSLCGATGAVTPTFVTPCLTNLTKLAESLVGRTHTYFPLFTTESFIPKCSGPTRRYDNNRTAHWSLMDDGCGSLEMFAPLRIG